MNTDLEYITSRQEQFYYFCCKWCASGIRKVHASYSAAPISYLTVFPFFIISIRKPQMMMLPVELPLVPSSLNCLAWSGDGELAIAAREDIHLLVIAYQLLFCGFLLIGFQIPRRKRDPHEADDDIWFKVRFKANSFTPQEWPLQGPRSFQDMSVGEEQSESHVAAIAWSPPGLALHKRSVLAVLTNNCILSLWASISDPRESSSWKRIMVVNQSVDGASQTLPLKRIHGMAWAPQSRKLTLSGVPFSARKWGVFMLAVVLDRGVQILDVSALRTDSSCSSIASFDFSAITPFARSLGATDEVCLSSDPVFINHINSNDRPSLMNVALRTAPIVNNITFSPFMVHETTATAILTFPYSTTVAHVQLRLGSLDPQFHSSFLEYLPVDPPRVSHDGGLSSHDMLIRPAAWESNEVS